MPDKAQVRLCRRSYAVSIEIPRLTVQRRGLTPLFSDSNGTGTTTRQALQCDNDIVPTLMRQSRSEFQRADSMMVDAGGDASFVFVRSICEGLEGLAGIAIAEEGPRPL